MSAYVYVMRSTLTGKHSVGVTADLARKVASSRRLTVSDAPWECVYVEICNGMDEAKDRVQYLKSLEDQEKGIRLLYSSRISTRPGRGDT
ncbi:MAG: hypothetical protein KDD67_04760 [Ignavibacteriae bacterium]|nr:hypothetical protein [Ignavibacteriota bacterium]MCB9216359.1 hypothetical protein [Ignavibacteria bacterium]